MSRLARVSMFLVAGFFIASCTGPTGPAGPAGSNGTNGSDGANGANGATGPQGVPGPTTGTLAGAITDGVAKTPLAGVAVKLLDAGGGTVASATTDDAGAFSLTAPGGALAVSFAKQYYTSPPNLAVSVLIGRTVTISVTMNEAASAMPSVALAAAGNDVGYGATVALTATAASPVGNTLSYKWTNTTSPIIGTVSGTDAAGTLVTPTMAQAFATRVDPTNPNMVVSGYTIPDRFGILPIMTDTRGQVSAQVSVSDGHGQSASAALTVNATSVRGKVANVAIGTRVYLNSGHAGASAWSFTPPAGSQAALDDATSRTPSFLADVSGTYTVGESGKSLTITAGDWLGMIAGGSGNSVTVDSTCLTCHQNAAIAVDEFTPWLGTGHATWATQGMNGVLSSHYSGACFECHTVGNDPGAVNHGFDDVAAAAGYSFPATLAPTNWSDMVSKYPTVARMANIQCENCHGPQNSAAHMQTDTNSVSKHHPFASPRISYGAELCGTCHAAGAHHLYSEWATPSGPELGGASMYHGKLSDALSLGMSGATLNTSCGRCHTAQGYTLYLATLSAGKVAIDTTDPVVKEQLADLSPLNIEPVTCTACHDPHDASNPNQLRVFGDTAKLPGGFAGYGMGKGALCLTCHNSRNGAQTGSVTLTYLHEDGETYNGGNPTGYSAPHQAAQGDVFTGHNAYFMAGLLPMTSKHAAVEDTCVGCHMKLNPVSYLSHGTPTAEGHLFRIAKSDEATLCANCHGATVDGEGIQASVEANLGALATKMGNAAMSKVNAIAGGNVNVVAYDASTDLYSSSKTLLTINVATNPVTSVALEEIHGQIGLVLTLTTPVAIQFVDSSNNPVGAPKSMATFGVQLGSLKDGQATPAALYALTGNFVRAGWNYFLVEGDQSLGLHNPTFVQTVLASTLKQDLSN